MEPGIQELIKNTSTSAPELCNDGVSELNLNNMQQEINSYASVLLKRPDYMGMSDLHFTSLYSKIPLFSSIMQAVSFAAGFQNVNLHPELKIKDMTGHSFDLQPLCTESTISVFKEAVSKVNDLAVDESMEYD